MKTGRPKLDEDKKKGSITGARLRDDERALVERAAIVKKQKLSDWIRATLLSAAKRQIQSAP